MKIDKLLLLSLLPLVSCERSEEQVNKDLENIDSKFYKTGASLDILNEYDSILKELKDLGDLNKINNVNFKHGLINYSLKRDKLALNDFENCITRPGDRTNGINNLCFEKFIELNLNMGKKSKILEKLNEVNDLLDENIKKSVLTKIEEYDELTKQLNKSINLKDWGNCLINSEEFLNIFKNDIEVRKLRIQCILNFRDYEFDEKIKRLIEEYGKLLVDDENNLENFAKLSEISLFENRNVGKIIKNCLKIDNEFESCRKISKINLKFDKILNLIKDIDNYYSFVYMKLEEGAHGDLDRISELEVETEDWQKLNNYLFEEESKIKLKNENERKNLFEFNIEKFKNNYEILIQLYLVTFKKIGFEEEEILKNASFLKNLNMMGKESYFQIGQFDKYKKNGYITKNKYFKKINANKKVDQDVVDICVEVDKLLAKRNIGKLKEIFDGTAESLKKTRSINQRLEKFNAMMQQDEKHRQFAQQQQQQKRRQQQQQQQQQQYQQQQQPLKPKNDYYKVLGISKDATDVDIKKAYREKMRQNHPDKIRKTSNLTDDQIEDQVAEINNAYEILSDSEKKQSYDRYGDDPNDPNNARRQQQHQQHQQQQQMHNPFGGGFGFPQNGGGSSGGHGFNFGGFNFDFGGQGQGQGQGTRPGQKRSGGRNRAGGGRRGKR